MNAVETAREGLLAQLEPLDREEADLEREKAGIQTRIDKVKETRGKIMAAVEGLDRPVKKAKPKTSKKANAASKAKASDKAAAKYVHKPDVEAVCTRLLKANPALKAAELKNSAEYELVEKLHFHPSGVGLGIDRWLGTNGFVVADEEEVLPTTEAEAWTTNGAT